MGNSLVIGPDRAGRTVCVENGVVVEAPPAGAQRLACPDGDIAPGAVCAHTHLYSGLAPYGMPPAVPPPVNFPQILARVWWRLDRALDAASLHASARDYVARALLAGTTSLVDHHESPNLIDGSLAILAGVCEALGMRAVLCYGATERNGGLDEGKRGIAECGRVPRLPLVRGMVGLHASFTVSDATVRLAAAAAERLGTTVHVHVAEDVSDVEDAKARGHEGPLERLLALGALPPGSIVAHGVHLTPDEMRLATERGLWLVQNPRSNEGNRVGYATNLRHAGRVALGTDGWDANMGVEEAALARLAEANGDDAWRGRLAAGAALMAEKFGAAPVAPLTPGSLGDVVVREGGRVRHVVVGGRHVVEDGRLVGADLEEIDAVARSEAERLWRRMASIP